MRHSKTFNSQETAQRIRHHNKQIFFVRYGDAICYMPLSGIINRPAGPLSLFHASIPTTYSKDCGGPLRVTSRYSTGEMPFLTLTSERKVASGFNKTFAYQHTCKHQKTSKQQQQQ